VIRLAFVDGYRSPRHSDRRKLEPIRWHGLWQRQPVYGMVGVDAVEPDNPTVVVGELGLVVVVGVGLEPVQLRVPVHHGMLVVVVFVNVLRRKRRQKREVRRQQQPGGGAPEPAMSISAPDH
jgi:hypothetical protein